MINGIIETMDHPGVRDLLRANYDALCLGGIMADTFFYSSNKDVVKIGEVLHGKDGERTNWLTFELLDHARRQRCEKYLSLTMGYISHCVFDITFHPVIYYLTGNYYDKDSSRREMAVYNHRLMETRLDSHVNNRFYVDEILDENDHFAHESLEVIADKCNITNGDLLKAYRKQIRGNKCFRNGFMHKLIRIMSKLRILDYKNVLPLFYHHLKKHEMELSETIRYRDIISGSEIERSLSSLLKHAQEESIRRIKTAFAYYEGKVDLEGAMLIIRGESLDTGREECPVHMVVCSL
ncbi:MAG TPA: zinc dependent phospholipase C family protein [Geobacteraceae bacterium]